MLIRRISNRARRNGVRRVFRASSRYLYFFSVDRQEVDGALPGIGCIGGAVAVFVVGVFEGVAGVVVNLDVDFLAQLFQRGFKFVDIVGGDAAILAAEQAEDGRVDFLQRIGSVARWP